MFLPALLAVVAGALIVVSRNLNAELSHHIGLLQGAVFNYIVGFALSLVFTVLTLNTSMAVNIIEIPIWAFTGGLIGVCVVIISNYVAVRIAAFTLTLIVFFGQLITGLLLDTLKTGNISIGQFLGAVLVVIGFLYNSRLEEV